MIELLITLIVVGFMLWLVETFIPLDPKVKLLLQVVVVLVLLLYVLNYFGVMTGFHSRFR
jgi:hypothetical protein